MPRTCLISAIKNEGPDLLEWAAYHHMIGFDHLLVYSNDCSDGSDDLLDAIATQGWLTHHRHTPPSGVSPQDAVAALAIAAPAYANADYAMWLDADEFLLPHIGAGRLEDLIAAMRGADALSLNWRCFGDGGHDHCDGSLVTERFTMGMTLQDGQSRSVKTLFRTGPQIEQLAIHRPIFAQNAEITLRDGGGKPLGHAFQYGRNKDDRPRHRVPDGRQSWRIGQINHYAVKALDRFALKRLRGNGLDPNSTPDRFNLEYLTLFNHNTMQDTAIARHSAALGAEIAALLRVPDVARAYAACRALDIPRRAAVAEMVPHFAATRRAITAKD